MAMNEDLFYKLKREIIDDEFRKKAPEFFLKYLEFSRERKMDILEIIKLFIGIEFFRDLEVIELKTNLYGILLKNHNEFLGISFYKDEIIFTFHELMEEKLILKDTVIYKNEYLKEPENLFKFFDNFK